MDDIQPTRTEGEPIGRLDTTATTRTVDTTRTKKPWRSVGNPAPLVLGGFALTTFVLALVNLQTQGVRAPNLVLGPALAYGGVAQFCAGMWYGSPFYTPGGCALLPDVNISREMAIGNTFGATALGSYGAFWVSYFVMIMPSFGVAEAYPSTAEYNHANGFFLMVWIYPTRLDLWSASHCCIGVLHILGSPDTLHHEDNGPLFRPVLLCRHPVSPPGPCQPVDR